MTREAPTFRIEAERDNDGAFAIGSGARATNTEHHYHAGSRNVFISLERSAPDVPSGGEIRALANAAADGVVGLLTDKIADLSHRLGVTEGAAHALLRSLGHEPVPVERLPDMLAAAATQAAMLREAVARSDNDHDDSGALRHQITAALDNGSFEEAERLLQSMRARERQASAAHLKAAEHSRQVWLDGLQAEANTCALLARTALTRHDVTAADRYFLEGIELLAPAGGEQRWSFDFDAASALYEFGIDAGRPDGLEAAARIWHLALELVPRDVAPRHWAMTQNNLACTLMGLGEHETGTKRLIEALVILRTIVDVHLADAEPSENAIRRNNLGAVLQTIGEREDNRSHLEETVKIYRTALAGALRHQDSLTWAMIGCNLGNVLLTMGEREPGVDRFQEAARLYREVLTIYTRDKHPLNWTRAQNNYGNVLWRLGWREGSRAVLGQAIKAFRAALEERPRETVPLMWATTQNNLGNALQTLAKLERGTARLKEALGAYQLALEERTRERVPVEWAQTKNNIAYALHAIGLRTPGTKLLEEAVRTYHEALEVRTIDNLPHDFKETMDNLGRASRDLEARQIQGGRR